VQDWGLVIVGRVVMTLLNLNVMITLYKLLTLLMSARPEDTARHGDNCSVVKGEECNDNAQSTQENKAEAVGTSKLSAKKTE
jgi:hypothetical protein